MKVTVVTICLNNLDGLRKTLSSVDAQDLTDVESIVVDGGSNDGTVDFLREWTWQNTSQYVSEPDSGIYDAMNKGLALAQGELIIFMNAGDAFSHSGVVSSIVTSYQDEGNWKWGYGCARVVRGREAIGLLAFIPFRADRLALGLATIPHQATVMRTSLVKQLGGFDATVGLAADQELMFRASRESSPRVWAEFFADFEGGGVGSTRSVASHPLEMWRARRRLESPVGASWVVDSTLTVVMIAARYMLRWQSALRRRLIS